MAMRLKRSDHIAIIIIEKCIYHIKSILWILLQISINYPDDVPCRIVESSPNGGFFTEVSGEADGENVRFVDGELT